MTDYRDRDSMALASGHSSATLNDEILGDIDPANLVRTAGNARLFDDLVLAGVNANRQHGPTVAAYLVADFIVEPRFAAFRLSHDPDVVTTDGRAEYELMRGHVRELAAPFPYLSKKLCTTAITACVLNQAPNISEKFLAAGVELRIDPSDAQYTAILVPQYLRSANRVMERYISGLKREGRASEITDEMKEVAYNSDARWVTRAIATSVVASIFDDYDQIDALETSLDHDPTQ